MFAGALLGQSSNCPGRLNRGYAWNQTACGEAQRRPLRLPIPSGGAPMGHMDICQFSRSVRLVSGGASAQGRYLASEGAPDVQHDSHETLPMKTNPTPRPEGSDVWGAVIPTANTSAAKNAPCRSVHASPTNSQNSAEFGNTPSEVRGLPTGGRPSLSFYAACCLGRLLGAPDILALEGP